MKVSIFLGKYSDWLEAYSIFSNFSNIEYARIFFNENSRNNYEAVSQLFEEFKKFIEFRYFALHNHEEHKQAFQTEIKQLGKGDILAAPFIRLRGEYCPFIKQTRKKGIITVHLSEAIPDSFGPIGYRLGFRMRGRFHFRNFLKQVLAIPYMWGYSYTHKPDICFYEMEPHIHNKFVRHSLVPTIPQISTSCLELLYKITGKEKRVLIIGGFGYNVFKIAQKYTLKKYIATSKNREIIIDGKIIPLNNYICAEEVILSGLTHRIIGYNSTVMCWAAFIGGIDIICYDSKQQSELAGYLFSSFSKKSLSRCGIETLYQDNNLIDTSNASKKDFTKII